MQLRNIVLGLIAASMLLACSTGRQVDYKKGAVQTPPLEVPPDLTVPASEQRYTIPGTDGEKVASYSEYAKQPAEQPCVAPASAPVAAASEPALTAELQEIDGVKSILLPEPFDRSWRKVGLALEQAGVKVTDKDRANGIYFIPPPGKSDKKRPDYQVTVHEAGVNSEVAVSDGDGESNEETSRLIEALFQNLGK